MDVEGSHLGGFLAASVRFWLHCVIFLLDEGPSTRESGWYKIAVNVSVSDLLLLVKSCSNSPFLQGPGQVI